MMKKIMLKKTGELSILLLEEDTLLQISGGVLDIVVYNPSEKVAHILCALAQAEGMFWWEGKH